MHACKHITARGGDCHAAIEAGREPAIAVKNRTDARAAVFVRWMRRLWGHVDDSYLGTLLFEHDHQAPVGGRIAKRYAGLERQVGAACLPAANDIEPDEPQTRPVNTNYFVRVIAARMPTGVI
jgi:hypothetical protein